MLPASLLLSLSALLAFVAVKLNDKSKRLERRQRQVECAHLANLAYARLLDIRAKRLGFDVKEVA
jgi:hypothetical protein